MANPSLTAGLKIDNDDSTLVYAVTCVVTDPESLNSDVFNAVLANPPAELEAALDLANRVDFDFDPARVEDIEDGADPSPLVAAAHLAVAMGALQQSELEDFVRNVPTLSIQTRQVVADLVAELSTPSPYFDMGLGEDCDATTVHAKTSAASAMQSGGSLLHCLNKRVPPVRLLTRNKLVDEIAKLPKAMVHEAETLTELHAYLVPHDAVTKQLPHVLDYYNRADMHLYDYACIDPFDVQLVQAVDDNGDDIEGEEGTAGIQFNASTAGFDKFDAALRVFYSGWVYGELSGVDLADQLKKLAAALAETMANYDNGEPAFSRAVDADSDEEGYALDEPQTVTADPDDEFVTEFCAMFAGKIDAVLRLVWLAAGQPGGVVPMAHPEDQPDGQSFQQANEVFLSLLETGSVASVAEVDVRICAFHIVA